MDPDELKQRQTGFMVAVGLLLNKTQGDVRDGIKEALDSFESELFDAIEDGGYARNSANGPVNPCTPGWHWDYELGLCVPNSA